MASLAESIAQWNEAVSKFEGGDIDGAVRLFQQNPEQSAKIGFNIGMAYLKQGKYDNAIRSFGDTIRKDQHLAAGYFQRGVAYYKSNRNNEALADFEESHRRLRGNKVIDYKQLGLPCKLYECEVLVNLALLQSATGKTRQAQESIAAAEEVKVESRHDDLVRKASAAVMRGGKSVVYELPLTAIYRPPKSKIANLKKKNFMGNAQVLSSIKDDDTFVGFMGVQEIEEGKRSPRLSPRLSPKDNDVFRFDEVHKVLYDFSPSTSAELEVKEGQVVIVTSKEDDGWCQARLKGTQKTGLVPATYLEPLPKSPKSDRAKSTSSILTKLPSNVRQLSVPDHLPSASRSPSPNKKLPVLPAKKLPMKPVPPAKSPKPSVAAKPTSKAASVFAVSLHAVLKKTEEVTIKLHMDHTRAIRVNSRLSLNNLQKSVCEKFQQEQGSLSLWHMPNGELVELVSEKNMADMWQQAMTNNHHVTLWVYSAS